MGSESPWIGYAGGPLQHNMSRSATRNELKDFIYDSINVVLAREVPGTQVPHKISHLSFSERVLEIKVSLKFSFLRGLVSSVQLLKLSIKLSF